MLKTTAAPSQTRRTVILSFAQFCRWLLWRVVTGCALAALVLAAWAWWIQKHEVLEDFGAWRALKLMMLTEQRAQVVANAGAAGKRVTNLQAEARTQEQNATDAARAVEAHKALQSSWQRWFGDREQQELNDKLLAETQKNQADASAKTAALKKELSDAALARERANIEVARVDARIQALEKAPSKWEYYASAVWERGRLVAAAIAVFWVLWTPALRAVFYYLVAPFVVRRKALRLAAPLQREEGVDGITTSESGRTVTIALGSNEVLRVKPELVESADDGLTRREKRGLVTTGAAFPLAKILCRLTRFAELRKKQVEPGPVAEDTATRMVVLRGMGKWKGAGPDLRKRRAELVMVVVPQGASLALRPRYLAGAVSEAQELDGEGRSPCRPTRQSRALLSADVSSDLSAPDGEALRASSGGLETAAPCASVAQASVVSASDPRAAVARASVAGKTAIAASRAPLAVRAHWRFFNWHAWVTGQFRVFEFAGPCRLIVAGQRGVRVEWIEEREDGLRPVARVEPWAVMGFDAALRYRPARTVSFWNYCKGARPLYDDLFIGAGMYLAQTTPPGEGRYDSGWMRRRAARCWRRFQKIFGM